MCSLVDCTKDREVELSCWVFSYVYVQEIKLRFFLLGLPHWPVQAPWILCDCNSKSSGDSRNKTRLAKVVVVANSKQKVFSWTQLVVKYTSKNFGYDYTLYWLQPATALGRKALAMAKRLYSTVISSFCFKFFDFFHISKFWIWNAFEICFPPLFLLASARKASNRRAM